MAQQAISTCCDSLVHQVTKRLLLPAASISAPNSESVAVSSGFVSMHARDCFSFSCWHAWCMQGASIYIRIYVYAPTWLIPRLLLSNSDRGLSVLAEVTFSVVATNGRDAAIGKAAVPFVAAALVSAVWAGCIHLSTPDEGAFPCSLNFALSRDCPVAWSVRQCTLVRHAEVNAPCPHRRDQSSRPEWDGGLADGCISSVCRNYREGHLCKNGQPSVAVGWNFT